MYINILIHAFGGSFSYVKIHGPWPPRPTQVTAYLKSYLSKYLVQMKKTNQLLLTTIEKIIDSPRKQLHVPSCSF